MDVDCSEFENPEASTTTTTESPTTGNEKNSSKDPFESFPDIFEVLKEIGAPEIEERKLGKTKDSQGIDYVFFYKPTYLYIKGLLQNGIIYIFLNHLSFQGFPPGHPWMSIMLHCQPIT